MKYTQARELVEAALEILIEEITSGNSKEHLMTKNKMGYKKPSVPSVKKPSSPSPSSGLSPAVKMGARNTSARWRRGNKWVVKQFAKKQSVGK